MKNLGDPVRGATTQLADQRTDRMILIVSLCIVFTLLVGGFVIAAHDLGDQDDGSLDSPQTTVLDQFDLVETAQLKSERELDFVLESESGEGVFDTEMGSIEVLDFYLPDVMPLCLTQEELDSWYVNLLVIGGYELICGTVDVYQKGEQVGTISMDWYIEHGERCCMEYYYITFYGNDICLDSNQYPVVNAPFDLYAPFDTIPGKEVKLDLNTCWTGCLEPDQHFTISPTQSFLSLSENDPLMNEIQLGIMSISSKHIAYLVNRNSHQAIQSFNA